AVYYAANYELRDIEIRIYEIENILKNAEIVTNEDVDANAINIGSTVRIKDLEFDEEMEYKIVGSTEADVLGNKISNESPVGVALIGSKVGDTIEIETPSGEMVQYKILEIK
ncbi:MAG: GreA/GreB family elongation factor, partial [Lachnospiraceae bacterium]|nr:GreA/GreB family elongation factor [Lachnospiraceae bacterium]